MINEVMKAMEDPADPNPVQEGLEFSDTPSPEKGNGQLLKLLMAALGGEGVQNDASQPTQ